MSEESEIQDQLVAAFGELKDHVRIARVRRIFVAVPLSLSRQVIEHVRANMGFTFLCTITGLDEGATLGAIYHFARLNGVTLNLAISLPKDSPTLPTITDIFPQAEIYERELVDLLGVQVQGLSPGNRYPLPDDWPAGQFPLRKEWNEQMLGEKEKPHV